MSVAARLERGYVVAPPFLHWTHLERGWGLATACRDVR